MKLSYGQRKAMPKKDFALPTKRHGGKGGYPIEDKAHARNALARVAQHGSSAEKAEVREKVHKKYPSIGKNHDSNDHEMLKKRGSHESGGHIPDHHHPEHAPGVPHEHLNPTAAHFNKLGYWMPYASRAQEKYFNANKKALEAKGVNVNEWNQASKGLNLPRRIKRKIMHAGRRSSRVPSEHLNPNASHFDAIGADEWVSMAVRLNKRQTEQSKAAIRTTQLVKRLQNHANGEIEMSATQVKACQILLQKTLPDLKSTALTDSEGNSFSAQFIINNG